MTQIIDTPKCLLVEVPEGGTHFEVTEELQGSKLERPFLDFYDGNEKYTDIDLPKLPSGQYEILGLGSELTREGKREVVQDEEGWLPDFEHEGMTYAFSHDSFASLLRSHNLQPETTLIIIKK